MLPVSCIAIVLCLGRSTCIKLIWTCWGLRQRLVVTWAAFQHSVVYYVTDQCRKRLEACINSEDGHSEHLLWHCLPDIPVATHHTWFFSEPPTTTQNWLFSEPPMQQPSVRWKSFANHKLVWRHFQVGWASGLQFVFFWDNINNQKVCMNNTVENDFLGFPKVQ